MSLLGGTVEVGSLLLRLQGLYFDSFHVSRLGRCEPCLKVFMNHYDVGYTDYINGVRLSAGLCRTAVRNQEGAKPSLRKLTYLSREIRRPGFSN